MHTLRVVLSASIALSSWENQTTGYPSIVAFSSFAVASSHIFGVLLSCLQLVSYGCSTVTHSPVPGTQWTHKKYLWSKYPLPKSRCSSLALVSFFTNMIFNNHIHTRNSNYGPFVGVSQALALGPYAFHHQTHIPSLLIYLFTSPKSVSILSIYPDTLFLSLLLSSMPRSG